MTQDKKATYETLESLQLQGDYEELHQIAQFAIDAIVNDGEVLRLRLPTNMQKVEGSEVC